MSKVNRGEKILNRLVNEQRISPTGRDWLIAAIDPFHDAQLKNLEGWPDSECGASVVRCVKQSITVSVPAAPVVAAGANWDCHIVLWPWLSGTNNSMTTSLARSNNYINMQNTPITATFGNVGGLQIFGMKTGTLFSLYGTTNSVEIGRLDLSNVYTQGSGRLIGIGYEVHNTTADLYRQGSVTVYRQQADFPTPTTFQGYGAITAGGNYTCNFTGVPVRYPPGSTQAAMLLSGSRQWSADEGVYQVAAFMSEENPAGPVPMSAPVILSIAQDDLECQNNVTTLNYPVVYAPGAGNIATINPCRVHPIHQSGCIFSGLSNQTTLTINLNLFYESFPGPSDLDILVLAKPSAMYDPCVMELYSRLVSELPVGVPVRENGLGDWFLQAASDAAKYIGPAIAMLPHPIAKGAGAALTYLGNTGSDYVKRQQPPNAWEQESGISNIDHSEVKTIVRAAKQQQKKKDKKKQNKAVAQAALKKQPKK